MSTPPPIPDEPFDLGRLRELVELMEKHGLSEIDLRSGTERWRLRRGPAEVTHLVPGGGFAPPPFSMMAPGHMMAPGQMLGPMGAPFGMAAAAADQAAPPAAELPAIKSPTVGTYYESPA
ncbi:MAG: acetyl-CoA carboxylase, biotin carboxyl carrier protein, partial [Planctomycetaceae bacterium]